MSRNRSILWLTVLLSALFMVSAAQARLIVTVEDVNTSATDVFTDLDYGIAGATISGVQGIVTLDSVSSPIFGDYWMGGATIASSNYAVAEDALLGTASFNMNATALGANIIVSVFSDEFLFPEARPFTVTSVVNASTLDGAAYSFGTVVNAFEPDAVIIDVAENVTTLGTFEASALVDVSSPFNLLHSFQPIALEIGGDIGIDMSTRAASEPSTLAALSVGMLGLAGAIRRRRRLARR
jgi:hypothetical protein